MPHLLSRRHFIASTPALGADSHTGNREIASLLMANGARPDIFTFALLGKFEVVKAYIAAHPGIPRIHKALTR